MRRGRLRALHQSHAPGSTCASHAALGRPGSALRALRHYQSRCPAPPATATSMEFRPVSCPGRTGRDHAWRSDLGKIANSITAQAPSSAGPQQRVLPHSPQPKSETLETSSGAACWPVLTLREPDKSPQRCRAAKCRGQAGPTTRQEVGFSRSVRYGLCPVCALHRWRECPRSGQPGLRTWYVHSRLAEWHVVRGPCDLVRLDKRHLHEGIEGRSRSNQGRVLRTVQGISQDILPGTEIRVGSHVGRHLASRAFWHSVGIRRYNAGAEPAFAHGRSANLSECRAIALRLFDAASPKWNRSGG